MPRYAALIYGVEQPTFDPEEMQQYADFGETAGAAGVIGGGEALQASATATTIRVKGGRGGELATTDGPFAETKEVLGGFYLLDCADLDEAIRWASQIPGAWRGGCVEVRPVVDFSHM